MKKLLAMMMCAALFVAGCESLDDAAKRVWDDVRGKKDRTEASPDEIDFAVLSFKVGGVNHANAVLDTPRISSLNVNVGGNKMSFVFDVDLSGWGLAHTEAGAIANLFVYIDGEWTGGTIDDMEGGKFDWISSSRTSRDFHNIRGGYHGWSWDMLEQAQAFAFVITSKDGSKRSNVIFQAAQ